MCFQVGEVRYRVYKDHRLENYRYGVLFKVTTYGCAETIYHYIPELGKIDHLEKQLIKTDFT